MEQKIEAWMWEKFVGATMNKGFEVWGSLKRRFLMYECKMDVYEGLVGKYVTAEIGGEESWEKFERHWRKVSWVGFGSEAAIETWRRRKNPRGKTAEMAPVSMKSPVLHSTTKQYTHFPSYRYFPIYSPVSRSPNSLLTDYSNRYSTISNSLVN